ncbi:MAG: hypothetical protein RBU45_15750 [Myxococcota bacterium]|jgi:hypothetical protein|nr:hypothetical protein [Myxococcota bacterium]
MSRCTTLSAPRWSGLGLLSLLVLAPFAGAGAAPPSPPPPSPSPLLLGLLGDFDRPITPELATLLATQLGGDEELGRQLRQVAADPAQRRYLRVRATGALALLPTPDNREALQQLLQGADDPEVRVQAVVALGSGWYARDRQGVTVWLQQLTRTGELAVAQAARRTLDRLQQPSPAR